MTPPAGGDGAADEVGRDEVEPGDGAPDGTERPVELDPVDGGNDGRGGRRRTVIIGAVVAVVLVAAAITAVLLAPSDASGYSDEVEENFLAACTADGGDDVEPVCACLYEAIVDTIPYDRFEEVDDALVAQREAEADGDLRLPRDFEALRVACVDEEGPVATVDDGTDGSTTTSPPDPTTTTAAALESPIVTSDAPNAAVPGGVRPTNPPRPPPPPPGPSRTPGRPSPGGGTDDLPPETTPPETAPPETTPPS